MELEPGNYEFVVKMEDQDSRRSAQIGRAMLISNYERDSMSVSDIMLVNRLTTEGEKKKIVPNISGDVGHLSEGFFLFFEVYNAGTEDSLELTCRVYNSKKEQVYERQERHAALGAKTQSFLKVENLKLPVGTYLVTMDISLGGKTASPSVQATTSRTFTVRWSDMPVSIVDLDKAIDQMRYIARDSDLEFIRSVSDAEEKRKRFLDFWAKRDPDPTTPNNELMEEYYRRVEFTNKNYTHYLEGWRSDRGMVYIRLGPPENIERHPFDINTKPYEVWYYYQLQREFVFIDETGFGDYRLKYPTTDLWGRIR
ncbi:MAG: GWxTD domain-containing protein [Ignavibacteriales bacterium]|nr:GWxTD domain-containing protein [Ignavibacteriales bacterium]